MSDQGLKEALHQIESWLAQDPFPADAATIRAWHERFREESLGAERGPEWSALVEKSHDLSLRLGQRIHALQGDLKKLRDELASQNLGQRALKAYTPDKR